MYGTLRGALVGRKVEFDRESYTATVEGRIVGIGRTIRIESIHVHYDLTLPAAAREGPSGRSPSTRRVAPRIRASRTPSGSPGTPPSGWTGARIRYAARTTTARRLGPARRGGRPSSVRAAAAMAGASIP